MGEIDVVVDYMKGHRKRMDDKKKAGKEKKEKEIQKAVRT